MIIIHETTPDHQEEQLSLSPGDDQHQPGSQVTGASPCPRQKEHIHCRTRPNQIPSVFSSQEDLNTQSGNNASIRHT